MKTNIIVVWLFTLTAGIFFSCSKKDVFNNPISVYLDLPDPPYEYEFSDNNRVTLGRVLFYDTHLSANNTISCASCHKQQLAFSDNVAFSRGFENGLTKRNSLPIQNVAFSLGFGQGLFWDGRENSLYQMVLMPQVNHVEMGMNNFADIVENIRALPYYPDLFKKAFGDTGISRPKISEVLSDFVRNIISVNSRFDQEFTDSLTLNALETEGKGLFNTKYKCNSCHILQSGSQYGFNGFANIGLDLNYTDNGLGALHNLVSENGKFKIPNLRNVALTAPYMHDGRFATLEDVLSFYSHDIKNHDNLDLRLKAPDHQPLQMNISANEKEAIIAFLNSLTDYSMITDVRFSNPFKTR